MRETKAERAARDAYNLPKIRRAEDIETARRQIEDLIRDAGITFPEFAGLSAEQAEQMQARMFTVATGALIVFDKLISRLEREFK